MLVCAEMENSPKSTSRFSVAVPEKELKSLELKVNNVWIVWKTELEALIRDNFPIYDYQLRILIKGLWSHKLKKELKKS